VKFDICFNLIRAATFPESCDPKNRKHDVSMAVSQNLSQSLPDSEGSHPEIATDQLREADGSRSMTVSWN
jgi:hypothetical protein